MDEKAIRQKCEAFLKDLGVPCFLVFGWQKAQRSDPKTGKKQQQFGVISTHHQMPKEALVKGMTWALSDIVGKTM